MASTTYSIGWGLPLCPQTAGTQTPGSLALRVGGAALGLIALSCGTLIVASRPCGAATALAGLVALAISGCVRRVAIEAPKPDRKELLPPWLEEYSTAYTVLEVSDRDFSIAQLKKLAPSTPTIVSSENHSGIFLKVEAIFTPTEEGKKPAQPTDAIGVEIASGLRVLLLNKTTAPFSMHVLAWQMKKDGYWTLIPENFSMEHRGVHFNTKDIFFSNTFCCGGDYAPLVDAPATQEALPESERFRLEWLLSRWAENKPAQLRAWEVGTLFADFSTPSLGTWTLTPIHS